MAENTVWREVRPSLEGKWSVLEVLGEVNLKVEHQDGRSRVVHMNRVSPRFVRKDKFAGNQAFQLLSGYYNSIQDNETIPMNIQDTENVQTEIPRRSHRLRRLPQYLQNYELY